MAGITWYNEAIAGAALQATAGTGTAFICTLTVSDSGWYDFSRACLAVVGDTSLADGPLDLTPICRITALQVNGQVLNLVRGRNTPAAPGVAFSAARRWDFVKLPKLYLKNGDVVTITAIYTMTGGVADGIFAIPYRPDRFANMIKPEIMWDMAVEIIEASPTTAVVDATATDITVTFDEAGWVDLSRLVLSANQDIVANVPVVDTTAAIGIRSIQHNTDGSLVSGSGTAPTIVGGMFGGLRQRMWVDLGLVYVVPNDTITVSVFVRRAVNQQAVQILVPLLPDSNTTTVNGKPCVPCSTTHAG